MTLFFLQSFIHLLELLCQVASSLLLLHYLLFWWRILSILSYSFLSRALKKSPTAWLSMVHYLMIKGWLLHDWLWYMIEHRLLLHFHLKRMPPQFTYYCLLLCWAEIFRKRCKDDIVIYPLWWLIVVCSGDCCGVFCTLSLYSFVLALVAIKLLLFCSALDLEAVDSIRTGVVNIVVKNPRMRRMDQ